MLRALNAGSLFRSALGIKKGRKRGGERKKLNGDNRLNRAPSPSHKGLQSWNGPSQLSSVEMQVSALPQEGKTLGKVELFSQGQSWRGLVAKAVSQQSRDKRLSA